MRPIILLLLSIFSLLLNGCDKSDIVIQDPSYAIGTIDYFAVGREDVDSYVGYNFTINNEVYGNSYSNVRYGKKWTIPFANYKVGEMYMVQFDSRCVNSNKCNEGKESRMLFSYPVRDSADYNNYVRQFTTNAPE